MRQTRVGVLSATGTGKKRTIPALAESSTCVVTAIHGRNSQKVEALAAEYDVPYVYSTIEQFIDERRFDVAVVCSPPFLHMEHLSALLSAGVPCLVEKPVTLRLTDAAALEDLAKRHSALIRVAHHLRHQSTYETIKKIIKEGSIGEPVVASFEWSFKLNRQAPSSVWKLKAEKNGLTALYDAGIHCIDIAVGLFGKGEVVGANAQMARGDETYESVDVLTSHRNAHLFVRASRLYGPYSNDLKISGPDGQIFAKDFFTEASSSVLEIRRGSETETVKRSSSNPYGIEVEDFAREARGEPPQYPGTTLGDAMNALLILEQVDGLIGFAGHRRPSKG